MRVFKRIDYMVQVCLLVAGMLYCLVTASFSLFPLFIVGSWQSLSCFSHVFFKSQYYPARNRKYCLWIYLVLSGILIAAPPSSWFILFFYLPCPILWYVTICHRENKMLEHKSLIHLK